jgi:hypothetical protein
MAQQPKETPFDLYEFTREKYGDVVGLFFGIQPSILVSGYECIKEISTREDFSYRPNFTVPRHKMFNHERSGIFINIFIAFQIYILTSQVYFLTREKTGGRSEDSPCVICAISALEKRR